MGDWEAIARVGQPQAAMWFLSFVWLVNLLMLNMLLAIIMDYYTEVKGKLGDAETLFSQTAEIFYRWRAVRRGRQVAISVILQALDPDMIDPDDEVVEDNEADADLLTVASLQGRVSNMPEDQATDVLLSSYAMSAVDERGGQSITDAVQAVQSVHHITKQ